VWYEIDSVETATSLTLLRPYMGPTIAAGSATYTIGQCSPLPEDYQALPVFETLEMYFSSVKPDAGKAAIYRMKAQDMRSSLMEEYGSNSIDPRISEETTLPENANNYIYNASDSS